MPLIVHSLANASYTSVFLSIQWGDNSPFRVLMRMKWINTHKAIRKLELKSCGNRYSASALTTSSSLKFSSPSSSRMLLGSRSRWLLSVVVQSLSHVSFRPHELQHTRLLSFAISLSLFRLMSIESVMPPDYLIPLSPPSPLALSLSQHQGQDFAYLSFFFFFLSRSLISIFLKLRICPRLPPKLHIHWKQFHPSLLLLI